MMAGHPNEAGVAGLRNVPFGIFMGGADRAYDRNRIAAERGAELAKLHAADPGGYVSMTRIYPGLPHWMNRKDAEALPWMAGFGGGESHGFGQDRRHALDWGHAENAFFTAFRA